MGNSIKLHMMNEPYICAVIRELQILGYPESKAKELLVRHYRVIKRTMGFGPNAKEFAREVDEIHKALQRKYDPNDPNQIYIGDLRERIKLHKPCWWE
ncbi:hypothetical protein [Paenibacillus tyrfis]|uniref:hypothetical protein n=1 Tax=Paenibacillus tyrfis TaxID=1501230 RepID=UPI00209DF637|nr:hypothetical protein [Paenibacillus tyrfis]MCP1311911.1 hypothetical protein [Paenibacillus tyrfis]